MIQPSCVSLTELDLCHQPAFPNIFYHTMQSYVLQAFEIVATTGVERRLSNRSSPAGLEHRKKSHPSDDSFFYLFESTRRRRTSGGRSTATTGAARRHSNRSSPAGLEHAKKRGCRTNVRQLISYSQHKTPSFEKPGVRGIISLCD